MAVQSDCWAIACLGLAYKADIDDLRESPALKITRDLADRFEGKILVVEPNIDVLPDELYGAGNIELTQLDDAIESAGLAVMLTDHKEFRTLDRAALDSIEIIDTRGMWR